MRTASPGWTLPDSDLHLGARTPEETAISICAEIIATRAGLDAGAPAGADRWPDPRRGGGRPQLAGHSPLRPKRYAMPAPAIAMIGPSTVHVVVLDIALPFTKPTPCNVKSVPAAKTMIPMTRPIRRSWHWMDNRRIGSGKCRTTRTTLTVALL